MKFVEHSYDGICSGFDITLKEREIINIDHINQGTFFKDEIGIRTLDDVSPRSLVKIYCVCGKIVDLDRKNMSIKKSLKKDLECTACRNARIGKDIDFLNTHYERNLAAEEDSVF